MKAYKRLGGYSIIKTMAAIAGRFFVAQTPPTMCLPMTALSQPDDIEHISRLKLGGQFSYAPAPRTKDEIDVENPFSKTLQQQRFCYYRQDV